jgi:hypothetical protein
MRKAIRPYMTAGVAVVGASAIAIAPVIATPPDVKIVNPAVQQSAGPLDTYVETVREALENLEALLGSALALPAPTGWTLELALDSMLRDPGTNVALFVDDLEALGPLAGASLPALLENAAGAIQAAVDQAAAGNYDLAIVGLIRTYVTLAPVVAAVVSAPLKLLGPELADAASVVLVKSLNAAVGPVLSGIGKAGVAIQNIANALNAQPGSPSPLIALLAAPGTVADGVLNGYAIAPSPIAFPGLLTPGDPFDPKKPNPGPVALAFGLARGFGSILTPELAAATNFTAPANERVVTLDVNATPTSLTDDENQATKDVQGVDAVTNEYVMSADGAAGTAKNDVHRPRLSGDNSVSRSPGGAGLTTLRQGIREGIRDFRNGVRDAVKTVTGRADDRAGANEDSGGESPDQ